MSDLLQSGHHPDADQLNAFVEHVLPAHEHEETLAHLAVCADCRAVVALSLPPTEATLPGLIPAGRPWSSRWRLLWPLATGAAVVALAAVTVHLRNISIARDVTVAPPMAANQTPPPPGIIRSNERTRQAAPVAAVSPPVAAKSAKTEGTSLLLLQGRAAAPLPVAPPPAPATGAASGGALSANGPGAALSQDAATRPVPMAPAQSSTVMNNAQYFASPPADSGAAKMTTNAPPTQSARGAATPDLAQAILRLHPLPSGQPALSIVNNVRQNQTLAVDIHGALFLTSDFGEHWRPVAAQWAGRAVKVDLVYSASTHAAAPMGTLAMKASPQSTAQGGPEGGPVSISSGVASSSLSGRVIDTSGATVPGATVIASGTPTQLAHSAKTDATGHYVFDALLPGTYSVEATCPGFNKQTLSGVAVAPGKVTIADLELSVGAVTETVEVTAAAAQLELDEPETKMKARPPAKAAPSLSVFEMTTDTGERWVSADGLVWRHE